MIRRSSIIIILALGWAAPALAQTTSPLSLGGAAPSSLIKAQAHPPAVSLKIKLPFPAGQSYSVIQGNSESFTHTGFNKYAWDFALPQNTPVCAAAAGRVVRVKQDSTRGGPSDEHLHDGNAVIIDHGNGLFTHYLHLAPHSARVVEGQLVAGGEVIALSGNTGYSTTPHLHFHVQDSTGRSLPARFEDVPGSGIPTTGDTVTSANDGTGVSQYAGESYLPTDLFLANGIQLITRNLPGHIYRSSQTYAIQGRVSAQSAARRIAIYIMGDAGGRPLITTYATPDPDGFFRTEVDPAKLRQKFPHWSTAPSQSNPFSLAMAPVNPDGSFWSDISVPICIR